MSNRTTDASDSDQMRERVRQLEVQLLTLRRQLDADAEPLPDEPFSALEARVGDSWCLFAVAFIEEVLQVVWPDPLPDAPRWVLGCIDVAGNVVPLIDLRQRLQPGEENQLYPDQAMVLANGPAPCSFLVDELGDVIQVDPDRLTPPPQGIPQAPFVRATMSEKEGAMKLLLSLRRLSRDYVLDESTDQGDVL